MKHPRLLLAFLLCLLSALAPGSMLAAAYSPHAALAQRLAALPAMSRSAIAQNVGPTPLSQAAADRLYASVFKPETYGAKHDGVHDDTAAIQLAINASKPTGAPVQLTNGTYKVSAALVVDTAVTLVGSGRTTLRTTSPTLPIVTVPTQASMAALVSNWRVSNIAFTVAPGVTRADSSEFIHCGISSGQEISQCYFQGGGTCIHLGILGATIGQSDDNVRTSSAIIDRCGGDNYYRFLLVENHDDSVVTRNYVGANRVGCPEQIRLTGHVEACRWSNNDYINSAFYTNPTAFTGSEVVLRILDDRVRHNTWTNEYYDSMPGAVDAPAGFDNDWVNCWLAGAGKRANVRCYGTARGFGWTACKFYNSGYAAIDLEAGDGYMVSACRFTAAQSQGASGPVVHVFGAVTGATFLGNTIYKSGQNGESSVGHATVGFQVDAGATNVGVGGFNHVDPLIATGYSHYTADASVKVSSENFGADAPISTAYTFREDFSGTGTVDNAHALDAGGTPSGPLVLTKTGDGYGYPTTPGELLVTAPRGLRIDFALRASGTPAEFQALGFKHCYADSNTHYQITVSRSGTHYFFDLYKVDPALNALIGQGYTKMTPSFDLTNATGFTGGAVGLSYTCSADGTTHRILKSDGTVLLTATDSTGTPPLAAGKSGWYAGAAMDSGNSIQVGATSAMAQ